MVNKCVIPGCRSESYPGCDKSFHLFPTEDRRKTRWIHELNINRNISRFSVVCSLHFKEDDYIAGSKKKLKVDAVPTVSQIFPQMYGMEWIEGTAQSSDEFIGPDLSENESVYLESEASVVLQRDISTQTHFLYSETSRATLQKNIKVLKQKLKRRDLKLKKLKSKLKLLERNFCNYLEYENVVNI